MDWRIQVAGKKLCEVLPGGDRLHYAIQRKFGRLGSFDKEKQLKGKVTSSLEEILDHSGQSFQDMEVCEVGTGWTALTPLTLYALGARRIHTHDVVHWLKASEVGDSVQTLKNNSAWLAEEFDLDIDLVEDRVDGLVTGPDLESILESANVSYHLTGSEIVEPSDRFDLYYSYSVLHRIPIEELRTYLTRANQFASSEALQYHVMEHNDIYARHDESRNPYAYLQFTDAQFDRYQTEFSFQNRLRHSDIVSLFEEFDWNPLFIRRVRDDPALVRNMELPGRFDSYEDDDLTTARTRILARRGTTDDPSREVVDNY